MSSIRTRILTDFLILIALMGVVGAAVTLTNRSIQREQQRQDEILYVEFGLIKRAEDLVRGFNAYRTASRTNAYAEYVVVRTALSDDIDRITRDAVVGGNRAALPGTVNLLRSLIGATDAGADAVRRRDLTHVAEAQERISSISTFVEGNIAALILEELELARGVRQAAEQRALLALNIGTAALILVGGAGAWYAAKISRRVSTPLTELTEAAGRIAKGAYGIRIDERLQRNADETGSLARSFDAMVVHLQETIGGLQAAKEAAQSATKALESKNELLEKLNAAFIVREGRINELKAEIMRLGGTVAPREEDGRGIMES